MWTQYVRLVYVLMLYIFDPSNAEKIIKIIDYMTTEIKKIEQSNTYNVIDSMGRPTSIYIIASNIKEACAEAKKRQAEIGSAYYKVKRAYNGGVRG